MGIKPRTMRLRMTVWFSAGVAAIILVFILATLYHLREELIHEKAAIYHPVQPDFVLHGSKEDPEVKEIMHDLVIKTLLSVIPFMFLVVGLGWFLAGRSLKPIAELNQQLAEVRPQDLREDHLVLREGDREFREHVDRLNSLLGRLGKSFDDLSGYAAKVAHELRTPLTILRLKVESSEQKMEPELCESLLVELERLSHVVDQSLLVAKAERGSLEWKMVKFDLAEILAALVEDFQLLAADDGRELTLDSPEHCPVETDRRYIKQILQSFLTNALKHGSGPISVKLTVVDGIAQLVLQNSIRTAKEREASSLGLGLRVVQALVESQEKVATKTEVVGDQFFSELTMPLRHEGL